MQVSAQKINSQLEKEILHNLALVLSELQKPKEAESFLEDFFTPTEKIVIVKRLAIALLLKKKQSYQVIKDQLKVSSATISMVAELLNKPGLQLALQKIEDEAWAENMSSRILKLISRKPKS